MCGIFFIFDKDKKISEKLLNKTINQISYRGKTINLYSLKIMLVWLV